MAAELSVVGTVIEKPFYCTIQGVHEQSTLQGVCLAFTDANGVRMRSGIAISGKRCGREKRRLAAATSQVQLDSRGQGQSLWGFTAQQSEAGRSEKPQCLWRPARIVSPCSVLPKAPVMVCDKGRGNLRKRCGPDGVSRGDIASESGSPRQNKVLALCGRRLRGEGKGRRGEGQVFGWLS